MKILQRCNAAPWRNAIFICITIMQIALPILTIKAQDPCTLFLGILAEEKIERENCLYDYFITVSGTPSSTTRITQDFQFLGNSKDEYCITVNGTLIIDKPFSFTNCHFTMNEGSRIVVDAGTDLDPVYFGFNTFQGNETMWRGIKVNKNKRFSFRDNNVMDAEVAIDLDEEANYGIFRNHFASNWVSIRCLGTISKTNPHTNRILHANLYDRLDAGFLPEYNDPYTQLNSIDNTETPYAAILFDKEPMLQPTIDCEPSLVREHANGIIATDDNVFVEAFFFENISDENGYNSSINGFGIYGKIINPNPLSGVGRKYFSALGFGTNQSVYFTPDDYPLESIFDNVQYPIYTENFTKEVNIYDNRMTDILGKGIEITGSESIHIQDNRLSNYYKYGIFLRENSHEGEPNTINKNYIAGGSFASISAKAIRLEDDSYIDVLENYIDMVHIYEGICINNTSYSTIENNVLENSAANPNLYSGINLEAISENNLVSKNLISFSSLTSYTNGISVSDSKSNTFECNHISNFENGMYFEQDCNPTTIKNNIFYDASTAIYLNLGVNSIGQQAYGDNRFIGTYSYPVVNFNGVNVLASQFTQRPIDQSGSTDFWPSSFSPSSLFITGTNVGPSETICRELSDYENSIIKPFVKINLSDHKKMKPDITIETFQSKLTIHPNPAMDEININFKEIGVEYSILNAQGDRVKVINAHTEQQRIDISDLKPGLYFITNGNSNSKFIVL